MFTMVNGKEYEIRLMDCGDWTDMMDGLGNSNELWHWYKMYSLCMDVFGTFECFVCMGYSSDRKSYHFASDCAIPYIGFRPVLVPLDNDAVDTNNQRLDALKDGSIVRLGSLYLDGVAQENPQRPVWNGDIPRYNGKAEIRVGDTDPDPEKQIRWVKWDGLLVADRNILCNVSWDDLQQVAAYDG